MNTFVRLCCVVVLLICFGMASAAVGAPLVAVTTTPVLQAEEPARSAPGAQPSPAADRPTSDPVHEPRVACTSTLAPSSVIDGRKTDIPPGAVVCLAAGQWGQLTIQNIAGTASQRITFRNDGGQVKLAMLDVYNSQHLRILGSGAADVEYGLLIEGKGHTVKFRRKTEYVEFAHAEIATPNGIALGAKTQSTCPDGRGGQDEWDYTGDGRIDSQDAIDSSYVVHDLHFHHLFIRAAGGGEAMYIGSNDTFQQARTVSCATQQPLIDGVRVEDSIVQDFGRDGINIKGARNGLVQRNRVLGGSTLNDPGQNGAIKIAQNASVDVLDNVIEGNRGPGIGYIGTGGNTIARNEIRNVGGMFGPSDEQGSGIWVDPTGDGGPMTITDNTVENSRSWGIHVAGDGRDGPPDRLYGNRISGSGAEPLNVPQDDRIIGIPRGEIPTVEPAQPSPQPTPSAVPDDTPAGEAPTGQPTAAPEAGSTPAPFPTFPPLPTFPPPITRPIEPTPTPSYDGVSLPEEVELCFPSGACATYRRVDG